ncbi:MAG TPA: T9SS type A sorting domain-containing protein, partial [Bacteroidia bacterium]|nr:T9SS type A sorting domain-containing protein [Bacteroidia bacterium]
GAVTASIIVSPQTSMLYTVTGSGAGGCLSANPAIITVQVNALPVINISTSSPSICVGEAVTLSASGANTYTWSNFSAAPILTHNPAITTAYTVTGTDANGCMNTAVFTQVVELCTGINENRSEDIFRLFPNPGKGEFFIEITEEALMLIFDCKGQKLACQRLVAGRNYVSLKEFAAGVYLVKVFTNGRADSKMLIKQ